PDDNLQTMQETLEWAKAWNFEWCNFYSAMPYPGSKLYEKAIRDRARLPETWADYGQYSEGFLPLPTKYLSGEEVLRFRDKAFNEYFSRFNYLKMIEEKFGPKAVEHIKEMLTHKIERRWL
ncbi:B12-binding domain-containing radical SAM protein, partial [Patescibacteria group bacterium]|nr:B12-binding domain-containing radical SAM protein [Patescibacteria group bacterium]